MLRGSMTGVVGDVLVVVGFMVSSTRPGGVAEGSTSTAVERWSFVNVLPSGVPLKSSRTTMFVEPSLSSGRW